MPPACSQSLSAISALGPIFDDARRPGHGVASLIFACCQSLSGHGHGHVPVPGDQPRARNSCSLLPRRCRGSERVRDPIQYQKDAFEGFVVVDVVTSFQVSVRSRGVLSTWQLSHFRSLLGSHVKRTD